MRPLSSELKIPLRDLGFLSHFIFFALLLGAMALLGSGSGIFAITLTFVLIPTLDFVLGPDRSAWARPAEIELEQRLFYRLVLWAWVPAQLLGLTVAISYVVAEQMTLAEILLLSLPIGFANGGIGITIAHELGHRNNRLSQFLARALLLSVGYGHFVIEHNRGHHLRVATPNDPATARLGEGFWSFLPRTIIRQLQHAWRLELARLRGRGHSALSWHNEMIWFTVIPLGIIALLFSLFGLEAATFFVAQACIAVGLLEAVNYIEHYGLLRREVSKGVYEKVSVLHSWNANFLLTNFILFKLQRHADHHAFAGRRYQILRHIDKAPQLPAGYPTMVILALVPPLYKRIMAPRVAIARKRAGVSMDA